MLNAPLGINGLNQNSSICIKSEFLQHIEFKLFFKYERSLYVSLYIYTYIFKHINCIVEATRFVLFLPPIEEKKKLTPDTFGRSLRKYARMLHRSNGLHSRYFCLLLFIQFMLYFIIVFNLQKLFVDFHKNQVTTKISNNIF